MGSIPKLFPGSRDYHDYGYPQIYIWFIYIYIHILIFLIYIHIYIYIFIWFMCTFPLSPLVAEEVVSISTQAALAPPLRGSNRSFWTRTTHSCGCPTAADLGRWRPSFFLPSWSSMGWFDVWCAKKNHLKCWDFNGDNCDLTSLHVVIFLAHEEIDF